MTSFWSTSYFWHSKTRLLPCSVQDEGEYLCSYMYFKNDCLEWCSHVFIFTLLDIQFYCEVYEKLLKIAIGHRLLLLLYKGYF